MSHQVGEQKISEDEKLWGFLAWLLSVVGVILALLLKPSYRYAKYWAYLSASFFITIIIGAVLTVILSLIPIIGWIATALIYIAIIVTWIIGIIRSLQPSWWKPPLIYDIARAIGIESVERG